MRLRENLTLRQIGQDYIIVDPSQGMVDMSKVFSFNTTAVWLWRKIVNIEFDHNTIAELLQEEFEVSEAQALADAKSLISVFEKEGLLR